MYEEKVIVGLIFNNKIYNYINKKLLILLIFFSSLYGLSYLNSLASEMLFIAFNDAFLFGV